MTNMEFLDESIVVMATNDETGDIIPRRLLWRGKQHTVVAVGRQWDENENRHILVEIGDGTRLELQLRQEELTWHVKRVWWGQTVA